MKIPNNLVSNNSAHGQDSTLWTPPCLNDLIYDRTRILRCNLGTLDNDAKSSYDCIIHGFAMLAPQRLGMCQEAISVHAGVLRALQYTIKTVYNVGLSKGYYQSNAEAVLFGRVVEHLRQCVWQLVLSCWLLFNDS